MSQMLPKFLNMFKRRTLINKLDIYNLESIIVSFPDQEKLLKNVDSG